MIKELTIYTILCDNCGLDLMRNQEYSGFGEIEHLVDICNDSDWHIEGNRHYCPHCFIHDEDGELIIHNGK